MADFTTNTVADLAKGASVTGFSVELGTLLDLEIAGGSVDGVNAVADRGLAVTAATTHEGYMVYVLAGVLTVAETGTDQVSGALALVDALAMAVPASGVCLFVGSRSATTAVGELKDFTRRGELPATTTDGVLAIT